jgi:hypothetical protein
MWRADERGGSRGWMLTCSARLLASSSVQGGADYDHLNMCLHVALLHHHVRFALDSVLECALLAFGGCSVTDVRHVHPSPLCDASTPTVVSRLHATHYLSQSARSMSLRLATDLPTCTHCTQMRLAELTNRNLLCVSHSMQVPGTTPPIDCPHLQGR